jgi:DNA-binding response OmpR family regulator
MTKNNNNTFKILIADDEVEFASTLATRLELRGYATTIVHSGEQTLETISREVPDLLLLDLKMPDLDGLEVLAKLRENNKELKVIILTGHGSFSSGNQGMALGAFDYIMKPVELSLLLEKINEVIAAQ